jgi:hypothetical protein
MAQRNGYRSSRGRSAIARKTMFSGPGKTDGTLPSVEVKTSTGDIIRTSFFGGPKKGGAAPSATGFFKSAPGLRNKVSPPAVNRNFSFIMRTVPGPSPYGFGPHA